MRIWFNKGHSLFNALKDMEKRVPGTTLLVSARNALSPAALAGSEAWAEPEGLVGDDYVDWAIERAVRSEVDVFFPQHEVLAIADQAERFAKAGVRLELPGSSAVIRLLDDKAAMADDLAGDPILATTIRARGADDVAKAVARIRADGHEACVKPAHGVFARGYWHLVDAPMLACLDEIGTRRMPLGVYLDALREAEKKGDELDLIVMRHLPGHEASVDVHAKDGRLLRAVTRIKIRGSQQRIVGGHELEDEAERLIARYALNGVVNVQFKPDSDREWKILEINPRIAGGMSYSMPLGVDLAADWVRAATTRQRPERVRESFDRNITFHSEPTIRDA